MPQAYVTSPVRPLVAPPTIKGNSPKRPRTSRITSPVLSPKEVADYILERGDATSPIIAKLVLDKHVDSRALAELAYDSDSEDRCASAITQGDHRLADDFLRVTSRLRERLPPPETSRSIRPSLMEIALALESYQTSPATSAPAYLTPPDSPTPPEWDLDDYEDPEDFEVFAPNQSSPDDDEDEDMLRTPDLHTFRISEPSPIDNSRGVYSSLANAIPYTPGETVPLLSALDMHQSLYGYSPPSLQGGTVGLGDHPEPSQGDLLSRHEAPPVSLGEGEPDDVHADKAVVSQERVTQLRTVYEAPSQHPSRAATLPSRPRIQIPTPPAAPKKTLVEVGVQTEKPKEHEEPPSTDLLDMTSDAEDAHVTFHDARESRETDDESVKQSDTEEAKPDGDTTTAHATPKPRQQPLAATPRSATPAPSTPAPSTTQPPASPTTLRERDHPSWIAAPNITRAASEPRRGTARRPTVNTRTLSSVKANANSQSLRSAPGTTSSQTTLSRPTKDSERQKASQKAASKAPAKAPAQTSPVASSRTSPVEAKKQPAKTEQAAGKKLSAPAAPQQSVQQSRPKKAGDTEEKLVKPVDKPPVEPSTEDQEISSSAPADEPVVSNPPQTTVAEVVAAETEPKNEDKRTEPQPTPAEATAPAADTAPPAPVVEPPKEAGKNVVEAPAAATESVKPVEPDTTKSDVLPAEGLPRRTDGDTSPPEIDDSAPEPLGKQKASEQSSEPTVSAADGETSTDPPIVDSVKEEPKAPESPSKLEKADHVVAASSEAPSDPPTSSSNLDPPETKTELGGSQHTLLTEALSSTILPEGTSANTAEVSQPQPQPPADVVSEPPRMDGDSSDTDKNLNGEAEKATKLNVEVEDPAVVKNQTGDVTEVKREPENADVVSSVGATVGSEATSTERDPIDQSSTVATAGSSDVAQSKMSSSETAENRADPDAEGDGFTHVSVGDTSAPSDTNGNTRPGAGDNNTTDTPGEWDPVDDDLGSPWAGNGVSDSATSATTQETITAEAKEPTRKGADPAAQPAAEVNNDRGTTEPVQDSSDSQPDASTGELAGAPPQAVNKQLAATADAIAREASQAADSQTEDGEETGGEGKGVEGSTGGGDKPMNSRERNKARKAAKRKREQEEKKQKEEQARLEEEEKQKAQAQIEEAKKQEEEKQRAEQARMEQAKQEEEETRRAHKDRLQREEQERKVREADERVQETRRREKQARETREAEERNKQRRVDLERQSLRLSSQRSGSPASTNSKESSSPGGAMNTVKSFFSIF